MDADELIGTAEASTILGVDPTAVRQRIREGKLPARYDHGRWLIRRGDVEDMAARTPRNPKARVRRKTAPDTAWRALQVLHDAGCNMKADELAMALDRDVGNARKYLAILRGRGFVDAYDDATYRITDAGQEHLQKLPVGPQRLAS